MVDALQSFNAIKFQTRYGENCVATKKDGVVTIQGDKNGVRQMPVEEFMETFVKDQTAKAKLEGNPDKDTLDLSAKNIAETPKKEKHLGKAILSAFMPGLGQIADGRTKDGIKDMTKVYGLGLVSGFLGLATVAVKSKVGFLAALAGSTISGIGAIASALHSIVDAYKGGKKA